MTPLRLLPLMLLAALSASARTAADFFVDAPPEALAAIPAKVRLDMLDYFNYGSDTPSRNAFGGSSRIVLNNPDLLTAEISEKSHISIAVVPTRRDTVIALIETVATPVPDSHITAYDKSWTLLDAQPPQLSVDDFVQKSDRAKASQTEMPDMAFYTISYTPDSRSFLVLNTTSGYYTRSESPDGLALMQPWLTLTFDGKKWKTR